MKKPVFLLVLLISLSVNAQSKEKIYRTANKVFVNYFNNHKLDPCEHPDLKFKRVESTKIEITGQQDKEGIAILTNLYTGYLNAKCYYNNNEIRIRRVRFRITTRVSDNGYYLMKSFEIYWDSIKQYYDIQNGFVF